MISSDFKVYKYFRQILSKNQEKIKKKFRERYEDLSEKENCREHYKNLSEDGKQKLVEYKRNYFIMLKK